MKFSSFAKLTLAALIAVNGANALDKDKVTKKCREASEVYADCYFKSHKFTEDDLFNQMNEMCIKYFSDRCKEFYDIMEANGVLPGCEEYQENLLDDENYDIPFYTNFANHSPSYMRTLMDLLCEFNKDDDFCPIARNIAIGKGHNGEDIIYENCEDFNCHLSYVKLLNYEIEFSFVADEVKNAVNIVNGEKCQELFYRNEEQIEEYKRKHKSDSDEDQKEDGDKTLMPDNTTTAPSYTTTSNSVPTSTEKGRCGPDYGACAKSSECCSQYGWCGNTEAHCGTGCQSEFGACNQKQSTTSKTTTKTTTTKTSTTKSGVPTSTEKGRCGPDFGACAKSNECCSKYGWCGTSEDHCGTGCQSEFGACNQKQTTTSKTTKTKTSTKTTNSGVPTSTEKGRCGPNYGACAKSGYCCSKHNYCGNTSDYCASGCQPKYGICW